MKIERTKNASRNIVFGIIQKIYTLAVPFLMRTLMIYFMGVEYLGLSSLFTSILQVLNLTELGVGSAMVYSMYKPIVDDDKDKICRLMRLYRTYYRVIGLVIAVVGCILIPFIPNLIEEESLNSLPSEINVYILYVLNLAATVLTYWLFAYKNCLLNAHQRNDVVSKISIVITTLQYGLQIAAICIFHDYYIYLIVALATQALTNVVTAIITTKMYPDYKPGGKLPKDDMKVINRRIRDLFTSKVGGVVIGSADTLVISAFLGLTMLAVYQNYYYILSAIIGLISIIFSACTAGIGNSIIIETKEKNFNDLKKFTFIMAWLVGFCTCCLLCLYQPFMEIWVGEELMLGFLAVIFFCIYFYVQEFNSLLNLYKDASGMWHEDRFRPLVVALANLTMNLITVNFWGIYGVLASTFVATLAIGMPWLLHNLFTVIFDKSHLKKYLLSLLYYTLITIIACLLTYLICYFIPIQNDWATFFVRLAICIIVPNILFFIVYSRRREFKESLQLANKMTKGKVKFLRKYENLPGRTITSLAVEQSAVIADDGKPCIDMPNHSVDIEKVEIDRENSANDTNNK